jgi:uncharacterized membrane protein
MQAVRKQATGKARIRELLLRVSLWLKGLHALIEMGSGIALWVVRPGKIVRLVHAVTRDEVSDNRHDMIANFVRHQADRFSIGSAHFMAVYLVIHGVINGVAVLALLKGKLWAYPVSVVVFGGFIVYQVYRFTLTREVGLILLSVFDVFLIWLIVLEYRAVRAKRRESALITRT